MTPPSKQEVAKIAEMNCIKNCFFLQNHKIFLSGSKMSFLIQKLEKLPLSVLLEPNNSAEIILVKGVNFKHLLSVWGS